MKQYLDLRSELDLRGSKVRWGQWGEGAVKGGIKRILGSAGGGAGAQGLWFWALMRLQCA